MTTPRTTSRQRVLVIGSNSFSGSDFIDLLLETGRYEVVGVSRSQEKSAVFLPYRRHTHPPFTFHQIDLNTDGRTLLDLCDTLQPAYVVNFAAQSEVGPSWATPWEWFQTNAVAVTRLAHALNNRPWLRRYVHISSPEVYGTCSGTVREDAPYNPSTPYAASKAAGDMALATFAKYGNFPLVTVRATNVYGAHQQMHKIIPRSMLAIRQGRPIALHGGGHAVKSYIHIRDVSRGELAAMEQGAPGMIYHLSPDLGIAVRDLVQMICAMMGVSFTKAVTATEERLGQDAAYVIDSTRAREAFGWRPLISLEEGLAFVCRWIDTHWQVLQHAPQDYVHRP